MEYRNTPISGTNIAPAQLLLSRICKTKLPIKDELLKPKIIKNFDKILKEKNETKKYYYDKNSKDRELDINNKNIVFKENNI